MSRRSSQHRSHAQSQTIAARPPTHGAARSVRAAARTRDRRLRMAGFGVIALAVSIAAISLVVDRLAGPAAADAAAIQVHASMGGFEPGALTVKAGQIVKVELTSMDTSMHSDGGGWHEFAIDALGIDWKVGPLSSKVFVFTAPAQPGEFSWYCDICCGGKENPSMQGKLTVTA